MSLICWISSCAAFDGWPPTWSRARTRLVNSWPMGRPAKVTTMSVPARRIMKLGTRLSLPAAMDTLSDSRSEEHTSELQSLMRISYAVFCLKKKKSQHEQRHHDKPGI